MSQTIDTPQTDAQIPSTVIEPRTHEEPRTAQGALDAPTPPPEKPGTVRDAVAKAWDEQDKAAEGKDAGKQDDKAAEKPLEEDAKVDPKAAEKAAKEPAEKPVETVKDAGKAEAKPADETAKGEQEKRRADGRPFYEAPKNFLPAAKEVWSNVPNAVKAEVDRITRDHEAEVSQYRESHESWQKIAKFDQMAKQHGTSVNDALERYTAVDHLLKNQPLEGIRQILQTVGITPQQYAEFITKNPQAAQAPRQQPQPDPQMQRTSKEVEDLRNEIASMKQEAAAKEIIEPFKAKHPRFDEMQEDIAFFLNSGKIPLSLSPTDKLAAAYDMAERINPRSRQAAPEPEVLSAPEQPKPVVDPRGEKSIRGGPSAGFDPAKTGRVKNRRAAIENALADYGA